MPGIIARACGDGTTRPLPERGRMNGTSAADNAEVGAPTGLDENASDRGVLLSPSSCPPPPSRRPFSQGATMNRRQIASLAASALVVMTFAAPAPASAQAVISAGAKGGVNIANVDLQLTGITVSAKSRAGLVIGGFVAVDKDKAGLVV